MSKTRFETTTPSGRSVVIIEERQVRFWETGRTQTRFFAQWGDLQRSGDTANEAYYSVLNATSRVKLPTDAIVDAL